MAVERMPITPEVLTWARERAGYKIEELAAKRRDFKRIAEWESGHAQPTYRQVVLLSEKLRLPSVVFFFPEPPDLPEVEESFRTLGSLQFDRIPPQVRLLLHKAKSFQISLAELNDGRNPARSLITRDLALTTSDATSDIAISIRERLGVSIRDQFAWRDADTAFKAWRNAFYNNGVSVFKDAFGAEEYCGFSLYDDEFPVIYVNNSNTKTRQVFTLFHELAHLLYHTSGIDTHDQSFVETLGGENRSIELQCNRLAAQMLLPEDAFQKAFDDSGGHSLARSNLRSVADALAKHFSVSRETIYRKLLDRRSITAAEYRDAAATWTTQRSKSKRPGGNFYRTQIAYLGDEYIELAFRRYYQNRIDEDELADHLAIKPKLLDRLEEVFYGERA